MGSRATACVAATLAFVLYNANGREIASYDSQPAKYLAIEIARRHSLSLGHTVGRVPALAERPAFARDLHGNYRTAYPIPSALIAGGVAWILSKLHSLALDAPLAAGLVAKITASALTAATVAFALLTASRRVSLGAASLVALALGAGTNLWASVSQTLWQQETALCALMAAVMILAAREVTIWQLIGAGALLGVSGWARLQLAPIVIVLALSMPVRWGVRGLIGAIPIACVAAIPAALNVAWFGNLLGALPSLEVGYRAGHATSAAVSHAPWVAAAGLVFSPSRGLLVFSPIVAFALLGTPVARREGWSSDLAWCFTASVAEFVAYCFFQVWWAGHTYGPRYMLDLLPPLVPLAAAGFPALKRPPLAIVAALCLAWSILVAALGAFVYPAELWNISPRNVDLFHERLWDWPDSQLVRAAHTGWNPTNFRLFSRAAFQRESP